MKRYSKHPKKACKNKINVIWQQYKALHISLILGNIMFVSDFLTQCKLILFVVRVHFRVNKYNDESKGNNNKQILFSIMLSTKKMLICQTAMCGQRLT